MNITDNLIRIKEGKNNIITSLQQKGSTISADTLINDIPQFIENLPTSGGGSADLPPLEQKYEGATCFRIEVPSDNYEFSLNLCNDATKATYDIDWGDEVLEYGKTTDEQHHIYTKKGTYDINVFNLSTTITLGKRFSETEYSYLFLNSNNLYWDGDYVIKEFVDICTDVIIGNNIRTIEAYTFSHLNNLKSVIINDGVVYINDFTLSFTPNLKTLVLPQTLKEFRTQDNMGIEELILPNSVTQLNQIRNCSNLKKVQMPDNLTKFYGGFYNCTALEEIDLSNTKISSLPNDCFSECKSLKNVILPNTINELTWQCFMYCDLNYFVVPNGITNIQYGCFFYCENLVQVELPSTLTYIEDNAFYYCNSLQYIISHALTAPQIEFQTFYSNNEDKHKYLYIHNNADIDSYTSGYWGELLNNGWEIKYIEDIPTETTETTLKIKTKDNFPIEIDRIHFANLIDRQLVDDEYVFTFDNVIDRLPKNIYPKNELISITLPNTLQYILDIQFQYCSNLEYVDIPNGVVSIGNDAFYECRNLTEITIPSSVTNIGKYSFAYCYNLNKIVCKCMQAPILDTYYDSYKPFEGVSRNGSLYIYKGAKGFDDVDSEWYKELVRDRSWIIEYMEMPQPNNEIWYTSVDGNIVNCTNLPTDNTLVSNTYENGKGVMTFEKDLDEIATQMFYFQSVESVSLPSSITTIGDSAFSNCQKLKSITLPNNLTTIGKTCFQQCYALQEINLPDTITEIKDSAFYNCDVLEEIILPPQITTINQYTFQGCSQLKNITIPSLVTSIGNYAFSGCSNLEIITCLGMTAPTLKSNVFNFVGISVPTEIQKVLLINEGAIGYDEGKWKSNMDNYGYVIEYIKEGPNNNKIYYKSIDGNTIDLIRPNALPTLVSNTYENGQGVWEFETDVVTLGDEAFDTLNNLTEIVLPQSVTECKYYTFYGSQNLYSITFNSKVAPQTTHTAMWSNVGISSTNEKVIYIPNDADVDSYTNDSNFRWVINNWGFVVKNFNGDVIYF